MNAVSENLLQGDDELERHVRLYLTHCGHRPVTALDVEAHNGVITLRGVVPSFYVRQLAIACARRVAGVRHVVDHIKTLSPAVRIPLTF
jgi:osmotically-inducible protein OsmY